MHIPGRILRYLDSLPRQTFTPLPSEHFLLSKCLNGSRNLLSSSKSDRYISLLALRLLKNEWEFVVWITRDNVDSLISYIKLWSTFAITSNFEDLNHCSIFCASHENFEDYFNKLSLRPLFVIIESFELLSGSGLNKLLSQISTNSRVIGFVNCRDVSVNDLQSKIILSKSLSTPNTFCSFTVSNALVSAESSLNHYLEYTLACTNDTSTTDCSRLMDWMSAAIDDAETTLLEGNLPDDLSAFVAETLPRLDGLRRALFEFGPIGVSKLAQIYLDYPSRLTPSDEEILDSAKLDVKDQPTLYHFLNWIKSLYGFLANLFDRVDLLSFNDIDDFVRFLTPKMKWLRTVLLPFKPEEIYTIPITDIHAEAEDFSDDEEDDFSEDEVEPATSSLARPHTTKRRRGDCRSLQRLVADYRRANDALAHFSAVVFVDDGVSGLVLQNVLESICSWDPDLFFVRPKFAFLPSTSSSSARQNSLLKQLRRRDINFLILRLSDEPHLANSVRFRLVLLLTAPRTFRQYAHVRRRAVRGGSVLTFCAEVEEARMAQFRQLDEYLLSHCDAVSDAFLEHVTTLDDDVNLANSRVPGLTRLPEISERLGSTAPADPPTPPPRRLRPRPDGPYVDITDAIHLVNLYCATLPSDAETRLVPIYTVDCVAGAYTTSIQLPINCPIREKISGVSCDGRHASMRSAAMCVCEMLHARGELNDQLQPASKAMLVDEAADDDEADARNGSMKHRRLYRKGIAVSLQPSLRFTPEPTLVLSKHYLYRIVHKITCKIPSLYNIRNRPTFDPELCTRSFGVICQFPLPKIPTFPVYTRSGEEMVSFELITSDYRPSLSAGHPQLAHWFHRYIWAEILGLERAPMQLNPSDAPLPLLVVPLVTRSAPPLLSPWQITGTAYEGKGNIDDLLVDIGAACKMRDSSCFDDAKTTTITEKACRDAPTNDDSGVASATPLDEISSCDGIDCRSLQSDIDAILSNQKPVEESVVSDEFPLDETYGDTPVTVATLPRIDWAFVRHLQRQPLSSHQQRQFVPKHLRNKDVRVQPTAEFQFDADMFRDAVVMPLYRNADRLQMFYVAQFLEDLTPVSPFPSPELYATFEEYYQKKYGLVLTNSSQPLLDVDFTSNRLNLVTPRYLNQKGLFLLPKTGECGKQRREALKQRQILIPELCVVHPFPASLWRLAVCLPSIFHRLNSLALAEDLRTTIARGCGVGKCKAAGSYGPMDFGFDLQKLCADLERDLASTSVSNNGVSFTNVDRNLPPVNPIGDDNSTTGDAKIGTWNAPGGFRSAREQSEADASSEYSSDDSSDEAKLMRERKKLPTVKISLGRKLKGGCQDDYVESGGVSFSRKGRRNDVRDFDFDSGDDLTTYPGPSPCLLLQALTTTGASDFFNLERLEMVGDSFLKFAVSVSLFCRHLTVHEGELSTLRSHQISNVNLFRLGSGGTKARLLANCATTKQTFDIWRSLGEISSGCVKFEPTENYLPPGYAVPGYDVKEIFAEAKEIDAKLELPSCIFSEQALGDKCIADFIEALIGLF